MKQRKIPTSEIIESFDRFGHIGKIAAHLKVPHITIWRRCQILGLVTKAPNTGKRIPLEEILAGDHPYYQTLKLKCRLIKEKILDYTCHDCGISEWQNKPITLQLDHIDGDNSNHRLENLRLICPNCHSQTDTWCGKNVMRAGP